MPRHARIVDAVSLMHAQLMKGLGQGYVQHINRTCCGTGTLFEARSRLADIETDGHLFACHRYIVLSPVHASMVRTPEDDRWLSDRCNALGFADPVIAPHPLYLDLSDGRRRDATLQVPRTLPRRDTAGHADSPSRCDKRWPRFGQPMLSRTDCDDDWSAYLAQQVRPTEERADRYQATRPTEIGPKPWSAPGFCYTFLAQLLSDSLQIKTQTDQNHD